MIFDPPYSIRQRHESYDDPQAEKTLQITPIKREIFRVLKPRGLVVRMGWSSGGMGDSKSFNMVECLLVNHGGECQPDLHGQDEVTRFVALHV